MKNEKSLEVINVPQKGRMWEFGGISKLEM
jgi:hypothetical protein